MKNCLYVGNLPRECTEDRLRSLVAACGYEIGKVTIAMDRRTVRSRGFGFVEMGSEQDAAATLQSLAGAQIDGQSLKLGIAYRPKMGSRSGRAEYEEEYGGRGPQRRGNSRGQGRR